MIVENCGKLQRIVENPREWNGTSHYPSPSRTEKLRSDGRGL